MAGAFRILDFEDREDPEIVYLEARVGVLYLEERRRWPSTAESSTSYLGSSIPLADYA
jgi:hypothetical protein